MDPTFLIALLAWTGKFIYKALVVIAAVAIIGTVTLFIVEKTQVKRQLATGILPMWSMLMAYFLTMKGRLREIEDVSSNAFDRLGALRSAENATSDEIFIPAAGKSSGRGTTRFELKQALQESELETDERRSLFAPVMSALLKFKSDSELLRAYSNYLSDRMESLWSEKLQLVHAVGGGVESIFAVSKEVEALHFYVSRHLEVLQVYLDRYVAGARDDVTCENLANYWPYFLGQPDRLLLTAREDFLHNNLGERELKTLTLKGRVDLIEELLDEAREELSRKINKPVPRIEVETIWGR